MELQLLLGQFGYDIFTVRMPNEISLEFLLREIVQQVARSRTEILRIFI